MANAYQNYVKSSFEPQKEAVKQQIAQEKVASKSRLKQSSLVTGLKGPVATGLEEASARKIGQAGTIQLLNLDSSQRAAMYDAFRADRQEELQREAQTQQMIGNIIGGVGSIAGAFTPKLIPISPGKT